MKILVLHPGALGDIILSLPALGALRNRFPLAEITLAGNMDFLAAVSYGYADRVISLANFPLHRLYASEPLFREDVLLYRSYDWIISWTGAGDVVFTQNLRDANPKTQIASWIPEIGDTRHVSRIFIDSLGSLISSPDERLIDKISLTDQLLRAGEFWLRESGWIPGEPMVALHPGAGSLIKRWPLERFQALARKLVRGFCRNLFLIEGPAEVGSAREIARDLPDVRVVLAESLLLDLLAGALRQCRFFVGNDTGIAHLAAGLGVPSIVLFGPTRPENWAPRGQHVAVLRDVRNCHGCESGGTSDHTCLENISVEDCASAVLIHLYAIGKTDK